MAAWPDRLEHFLNHYPRIIAAVEAISTFAAVIVALWLSRRASQTRLTAYLAKQFISDPTTTDRPEYLVALITNTGVMTFYISLSFLVWTRPYRKTTGWQLGFPLDFWATDKLIPQQKYPVVLQPKASHHFIIANIATFRQVMRQCLISQSKLGRFLFRFVRITIRTDDGSYARGKIAKEIRDELRQIQREIANNAAQT
jgi:hypothetical protein